MFIKTLIAKFLLKTRPKVLYHYQDQDLQPFFNCLLFQTIKIQNLLGNHWSIKPKESNNKIGLKLKVSLFILKLMSFSLLLFLLITMQINHFTIQPNKKACAYQENQKECKQIQMFNLQL